MNMIIRNVGLLLTLSASMAAYASDDAQLDAKVERAQAVRERAEQTPLEHPWAGLYIGAQGFGPSMVSITADGEYAELLSGCFGPMDARFGKAIVEGDELTLVPDGKIAESRRLSIIRWGDMRYLVDHDEGLSFVNWINEFGLPSAGDSSTPAPISGYVRDAPKAVLPPKGTAMELPPDLAALRREIPVVTKLTSLVEDPSKLHWRSNEASIHARVDGGRSAGLFVGMNLYANDAIGKKSWAMTVTAVYDDSATIAIGVDRFDASEKPDLPPRGLLVSSKPPESTCGSDPEIAATLLSLDEDIESVAWDADQQALLHGTIDRGSADGVRDGTLFFPVEYMRQVGAKVENVSEHRSRVKLRIDKDARDKTLRDDEKPVVGMQLTGH